MSTSTKTLAREVVNGHSLEIIAVDSRIFVRIDGNEQRVGQHNDGFRVGFSSGDTVMEAARNFANALSARSLTIRRDFMDMSQEERMGLADALNEVWDSGLIKEHADFHNENFFAGIHWGPTFLPWHRYFLRRLELALQNIDSNLFLPYWDWTRDDSRDLDDEPWLSFFGGRANNNGQFDDWNYNRGEAPNGTLPTLAEVVNELRATNFTDFRRIEGGTHVLGHVWTGGDMASPQSPLDPLFYLHHCNLDRLWAIWQANNPSVSQYEITGEIPTDVRDGTDGRIDSRVRQNEEMKGFPGESPMPGEFLDCISVGHGYAQDSRLERYWSDTGQTSELITEIS